MQQTLNPKKCPTVNRTATRNDLNHNLTKAGVANPKPEKFTARQTAKPNQEAQKPKASLILDLTTGGNCKH